MTPPLGSARAGLVSQVGDAIPNSVVSQYDVRELSASDGDTPSTLPDGVENNDLSLNNLTYRENEINGNPAIEWNSSNQFGSNSSLSVTQRIVIISVWRASSSSFNYVVDSNDGTSTSQLTALQLRGDDGNRTAIFAPTLIKSGSSAFSTGTNYLSTLVLDGTNSKLRLNKSDILSGNAGTNSMEGVTLGGRNDQNAEFFRGVQSYCEIHDGDPSNGLATREDEIAADFGI